MRRLLLGFALLAPSAIPARAQANEAVAVVQKFIASFNKGDIASALATCAPNAAIIDEFAPYAWHGCDTWANAYDADAKQRGITDGFVTLGKPWHAEIAGNNAYVVGPGDYAYKEKGKPVKETLSTFSVVLQKGPTGWKITAWSWAKHLVK
jgi:ketosteroid isomerase-like protein